MKIIIVHGRHGRSKSLSLSPLGKTLLSVCLLGIPTLFGAALGYQLGQGDSSAVISEKAAQSWRESLQQQQQALDEARRLADARIKGFTAKIAELQARMVRLDALGEKLVQEAKLDDGELDFSQPPVLGGPEMPVDVQQEYDIDFMHMINDLSAQIDNRWAQLDTLQGLLDKEGYAVESFVSGRPVKSGWESSPYGYRADPFSGKQAWHNGVDFAGKKGSEIIAVAAGVITWSGEKYGYGKMVEINHGDGYLTRYAHTLNNHVKVGDVVKKGQTIAAMGSSGRSTGPHVHFEVYKHGRAVDPASYIRRNRR